LATDAWHPQVNGVVRSLATTADLLRQGGHQVEVIEPSLFWTLPCPTYPEIRLSILCGGKVNRILEAAQPDSVHVATEGPIGWAARNWCVRNGRHYTTAFHTRFPDYVSIRTGIPVEWLWRMMRLFHGNVVFMLGPEANLLEHLVSAVMPLGRRHAGVDDQWL